MKKYILALAAATLSSAAAFADTANVVAEPADTVLHVKNVNTVVITESASGVSVEVKGTENDEAFQTTCDIPYDKDGVIKTHQSLQHASEPRAEPFAGYDRHVPGIAFRIHRRNRRSG